MAEISAALFDVAAQTTWDAIVIGAGPSGALAARQTALAGLQTLLIDAKRFPRDKVCGGYLNCRALAVLNKTGLAHLADHHSENEVNQIELRWGRQRTRFALPAGRVICRTTFDAALVDAARSAGATILEGTQAVVESTVRDGLRCVTATLNGKRESLAARTVICADGLTRSSVRHLREFAVSTAHNSRFGIGALVTGDTDICPIGQITMIVSRHGYVGISRIESHKFNIAAAVDRDLLLGGMPAEFVSSTLSGAGIPVPPSFASANWRGTPPLTSRPQHVAAERVFLIGDAGGYIEPFTGEGMAAALEAAAAITPFAIQAAAAWSPSLAASWGSTAPTDCSRPSIDMQPVSLDTLSPMGRIRRIERLPTIAQHRGTSDRQNQPAITASHASRNECIMTFRIAGLGTAVPNEMITQDDAARVAIELSGEGTGHAAAVQTLYRKSGVRRRHSTLLESSTNGRPATQSFFPVATSSEDRGPTTSDRMRRYEAVALELATRAASAALRDSHSEPGEINHLVTVSCTGFSAPGVDVGLIESLGLCRGVSRTHIGFMGCHGALNGLRVAAALSNASPASKVLLCCVELCSIHHQYAADAQQVVANALFSDGAAAVVGEAADSTNHPWRLLEQVSYVLPETAELMSWRIGDNGFAMRLSPRVPSVIKEMLRPWLCEQLSRHALEISDVQGWAIHPGGPRILTACADSLGLDHACLELSRGVLAEYGNMSSPTVLFILDQLRKRGDCLPCVVLAFGPGLTAEAALIA